MYKVLIVEDEDLIRKGLVYIFDWIKHDCVVIGEASNGVEALAFIAQNRPDIILTDIKMPIMDGLQLLDALQNEPIETIIISGYAEFEYAKKAIQYGVAEYLLKPIDHEHLSKVVEEITDRIRTKLMSTMVNEKIKTLDELKLIDVEFYYSHSSYCSRYTPKVLELIKDNFSRKMSIDFIADQLEVSPAYLSKKFKEDTQHTFNDFLNRYRIQVAMDYMFESDMKIYQIAEVVGYSEYKYFSQVFKNYLGYSPSEFQQLDLFVKKI